MSENALQKLQAAAAEVDRLKAEVLREMREKANEGKLWQSGWCAAWPAYEAAVSVQDKLRAEFGV